MVGIYTNKNNMLVVLHSANNEKKRKIMHAENLVLMETSINYF